VRIAGWYALSVASVERARLPSDGELGGLPRFPVPAVLLARLAVDRRVQGQGLGTWLFDDALRRTLQLASEGPVGVRLFVTDAKDERAARFYTRRGMTELAQETWPRRLVIDLAPLLGQTPS
jgi:GNAT superfamily N-acetyltransferase